MLKAAGWLGMITKSQAGAIIAIRSNTKTSDKFDKFDHLPTVLLSGNYPRVRSGDHLW